jgi:uncharacterized protein YdhG (YjbR/CyaY superfamily)
MAGQGVEKRSSNEANLAAIERYLAAQPAGHRAALDDLRATIRAAAPDAVEAIVYGMPGFRYRDRFLVSYAGWAKHCAFYPMSAAVQAAHPQAFRHLKAARGTIQFAPTERMPAVVVRAIVQERIAELDQRGSAR